MNTTISFEIAKVLKEKGFDELCEQYYTAYHKTPINSSVKCCNSRIAENCYTAPTIAEVVMWLYEKHGIWISVNVHGKNNFIFLITSVSSDKLLHDEFGDNMFNNSPTEAYEAAIEQVLKEII